MKTSKLLILVTLLIAVSSCKPAQKTNAALQDDGVIEITILHLNDVYEISPLGDNRGGLARVSTLLKSLKAKNPNTIAVLAGDFISPSVIGTLKYEGKRIRGRQMVDCLNTLGLDLVVFGNHEFDYDDLSDLQARLDESTFGWLAGNARLKIGDQVQPFFKNRPEGLQPCPDDTVLHFKDADGTKLDLGVFGVLVGTGRKPFVEYSDPFEAAKKSVARLHDQSDVVVGLTHLDIADDLKMAAMLPQVSLIMGGHDHDNMLHKVGMATVAKADANAKSVYVHTIRYEAKTKKTTVRSQLRQIDGSIPDEPAVAGAVAKWEKIKSESLSSAGFDANRKVTDLKEPLDCRETIVRHQQAPAGDLICSAMLAACKTAPDCALLNSGSIRVDDILSGILTELDIVRMLPFGGGISETEMRGALLRRTLDAGRSNDGKGGYLQVSRISWDANNKRWLVGGLPLVDSQVYKVVLPDFLLTGNETNMEFLKAEPKGEGTTNADVIRIIRPAPADKEDVRRDIRLALIRFLRS